MGYDLLGHIPFRVLYDGVWLSVIEVAYSTSVRLQEDAIDLLPVDGLGAVTYGLHQGGDAAEVSDATGNGKTF